MAHQGSNWRKGGHSFIHPSKYDFQSDPSLPVGINGRTKASPCRTVANLGSPFRAERVSWEKYSVLEFKILDDRKTGLCNEKKNEKEVSGGYK